MILKKNIIEIKFTYGKLDKTITYKMPMGTKLWNLVFNIARHTCCGITEEYIEQLDYIMKNIEEHDFTYNMHNEHLLVKDYLYSELEDWDYITFLNNYIDIDENTTESYMTYINGVFYFS